jgi:hypothetical protein
MAAVYTAADAGAFACRRVAIRASGRAFIRIDIDYEFQLS